MLYVGVGRNVRQGSSLVGDFRAQVFVIQDADQGHEGSRFGDLGTFGGGCGNYGGVDGSY